VNPTYPLPHHVIQKSLALLGIYGKTDEVGYTAVENSFSVPDLFATMLHQLGLDHQRVAYKHSGRFENSADAEVTGPTFTAIL